jgi:hypothetical protein
MMKRIDLFPQARVCALAFRPVQCTVIVPLRLFFVTSMDSTQRRTVARGNMDLGVIIFFAGH